MVTHSRSQWCAGSLWKTGCQYIVSTIGCSGTGGSSTFSSRRTGVLLTSRSCTNANSDVPGSSHGTSVKLSVDSATLDSALTSNPAAVANFFSNTNATGFADNFSNDLNNLTAPATGVLNSDLAANQEQQTDLNNEISAFQVHLAEQATALTAEFDQVNASLEEYPFLLQEVTAALGSLSSTGSTEGTLPSTNTTPTSGNSTSGNSGTSGTSSTSSTSS